MLRRRHRPTKPGGTAHPERAPLTQADLESFFTSAEQRKSGTVPNVYDIEAKLQQLDGIDPINAKITRQQLRWLLIKAAPRLGHDWEHPYS